MHELLRTNQTASGRIEWFPAHPHEGLVSAKVRSRPRIAVRRLPFQFLDQPCPGIVEAQRDVSPILK